MGIRVNVIFSMLPSILFRRCSSFRSNVGYATHRYAAGSIIPQKTFVNSKDGQGLEVWRNIFPLPLSPSKQHLTTMAAVESPSTAHDEQTTDLFVNNQWPTKVVQCFTWSDIEKNIEILPPEGEINDTDQVSSAKQKEWAQNPLSLPRVLNKLDPHAFPSVSQARKACEHGKIVVLRHSNDNQGRVKENDATMQKINLKFIENINDYLDDPKLYHCAILGQVSTTILLHDAIVIQTVHSSRVHYPPSSIGYIYPPSSITSSIPHLPNVVVVYEDNHIAVVNKPENVTTVGTKREDLQSILPFVLHPPSRDKMSTQIKALMFPRPVHRLDRRTSGLVLVAKTDFAMSQLSSIFRKRLVKKSYVAVVFGTALLDNTDVVFGEDSKVIDNVSDVSNVATTAESYAPDGQGSNDGSPKWNIIDYPIDGKDATTSWRVVHTKSIESSLSSSPQNIISLLALRPPTGRYHQIRRHLAYCLQSPIVGDNKYDGGGKLAQSMRSEGMFLCSNALEFPYPFEINTMESNRDILKYNSAVDDFWSCVSDNISSGCESRCCLYVSDGDEIPMMRIVVPLPQKFDRMMS